MIEDRIEMHEFLGAVERYYTEASPWTKTYDELEDYILEKSGCDSLSEAIDKAGIDRMGPYSLNVLAESLRLR